MILWSQLVNLIICIYNFQSNVVVYRQPFPKVIPGLTISYSDHEAVHAVVQVKRSAADNVCTNVEPCDAYELAMNLKESIKECDDKLMRLEAQKMVYYTMAMVSFAVLLFVVDAITPPYGFQLLYTSFKIFLSIVIAFFVVMATFWNAIESNGILAGKLSMDISLVNALRVADPCKF